MYHPIDIYVGRKVRYKRKLLGLTQDDLAKAVDLTFQQIQKYEKGENRISASKIYQIAVKLGVDVNYFFEGLSETTENEISSIYDAKIDQQLISLIHDVKSLDPTSRRLAIQNIRHFKRFSDTTDKSIEGYSDVA